MSKKRGTLALLCVLLMTFTLGVSALTLSDADIKNPVFPWREHTLKLSLYSDDAAQVNDPDHNLMLTFESLSGEIPTQDMQQFAKECFLRTSDGVEHPYANHRIFGVKFINGKFSIPETQKKFELLFQLEKGIWEEKLDLLVGEKDSKERVLVRLLPDTKNAGAAATTPPTATPTAKNTLLPGLTRSEPGLGYMQADQLAEQYGIRLKNGLPLYTPASPQPLNAYMVTHPDCEVGIDRDGMYKVRDKGLVASITKHLEKWMGAIEEQSQGAIRFVEKPDDADILVVANQSYFFHASYRGGGMVAHGHGCLIRLEAQQLTGAKGHVELEKKITPGQTVSLRGGGDFWEKPPELKNTGE